MILAREPLMEVLRWHSGSVSLHQHKQIQRSETEFAEPSNEFDMRETLPSAAGSILALHDEKTVGFQDSECFLSDLSVEPQEVVVRPKASGKIEPVIFPKPRLANIRCCCVPEEGGIKTNGIQRYFIKSQMTRVVTAS